MLDYGFGLSCLQFAAAAPPVPVPIRLLSPSVSTFMVGSAVSKPQQQWQWQCSTHDEFMSRSSGNLTMSLFIGIFSVGLWTSR